MFNAVTLHAGALGAAARQADARARPRSSTGINKGIERGTNGYVSLLGRALRARPLMLGVFVAGLARHLVAVPGGAFGVRARRGRGLLHRDHPGAAGRLARVLDRHREAAEAILFKDPDILAAFSVVGFSFSGAAPNNGLIFVRLDMEPLPSVEASAIESVGLDPVEISRFTKADDREVMHQSAAPP